MPWRKVVGIGEIVHERILSEKHTKDNVHITQKIERNIYKTLVLECGHEFYIAHGGRQMGQKKMNCLDCNEE